MRTGHARVLRWYKELPTEADWLKARALGIGGSDIPQLVGVSSYGNALTVYLDKINPMANAKDDNEAMELGRDLEDWTARKFAARTGLKVRRCNAILHHPDKPHWLSNLDRFVYSQDNRLLGVLECKTGGIKEDWVDDRIPETYHLQGEWYCGVTGLPKVWFAALLGGYGGMSLEIREREADPEVFADLGTIADEFWFNHVEAGEPPAVDGSPASTEALAKLFPEALLPEIELPPTAAYIAASYLDAKAKAKEAVEVEDSYKNQLKLMLGEYEKAFLEGFQLTWKNTQVYRFDTKAFAADHPDLAARYTEDKLQRRLRCTRKEK